MGNELGNVKDTERGGKGKRKEIAARVCEGILAGER